MKILADHAQPLYLGEGGIGNAWPTVEKDECRILLKLSRVQEYRHSQPL